MNLNELIAEAELVISDYETVTHVDVRRSRTLLPLLVEVIKNQQRQIERSSSAMSSIIETMNGEHWYHGRPSPKAIAHKAMLALSDLAAELEDIKP